MEKDLISCGKGLEKSGNLKLNGCSCPEKLYLFCSRKVVGMRVHFQISMHRINYLIPHLEQKVPAQGATSNFQTILLASALDKKG